MERPARTRIYAYIRVRAGRSIRYGPEEAAVLPYGAKCSGSNEPSAPAPRYTTVYEDFWQPAGGRRQEENDRTVRRETRSSRGLKERDLRVEVGLTNRSHEEERKEGRKNRILPAIFRCFLKRPRKIEGGR